MIIKMAVSAPITGISMASSSCNRGVILEKPSYFRPTFFGHGVGTLKYTGTQPSHSSRHICYGWGSLGVLIEMRRDAFEALASQKQLRNIYEAAQQASEDWYRRAQLALGKGEEDLAREALKCRKTYADRANGMKNHLDHKQRVVDNLVSNIRLLESKMEEAMTKNDTPEARAQPDKTASKLRELLEDDVYTNGILRKENTFTTFTSMDELEGKFVLQTSLDNDDLALANLRKSLSVSRKVKELSEFEDPEIEKEIEKQIEKELSELRQKKA